MVGEETVGPAVQNDQRLEYRRLAERNRHFVQQGRHRWPPGIAIAVVALPIIGVARDGIMGIMLPEMIALLALECLSLGTSKIRTLISGPSEWSRRQEQGDSRSRD